MAIVLVLKMAIVLVLKMAIVLVLKMAINSSSSEDGNSSSLEMRLVILRTFFPLVELLPVSFSAQIAAVLGV